MDRTASIAATAVISLFLTGGATAAVASRNAVVHDITSQFAGLPGYVGLQTWAVFVQYQNPSDRMSNHGLASISATSGTFFNGNAVTDDPLHLISDSNGGLTPISPSIIAMSGYGLWAWDTNLSVDNNPLSLADADSEQTPTSTHGGAFTQPPPVGTAAGADLLVQVAQITMTAGGSASGETTVLTINPVGGNPIATAIAIDIPGKSQPCPADLSGDGQINTLDLGVLLSSWSIPQTVPGCGGALPCPADLNGDGSVNSFDLGILLSHWGGC